jgi:nitrite reductase/ring-hydroxylating ferredoxin subunit
VSAEALNSQGSLVALCTATEVGTDTPLRVVSGNDAYAVFNVDGLFYVTQDQCTHGPGSLAEGFLVGSEIECPFHQGRFDVCTGLATQAPCTVALRTWTVQMIDGQICIDPSESRGSS